MEASFFFFFFFFFFNFKKKKNRIQSLKNERLKTGTDKISVMNVMSPLLTIRSIHDTIIR